MNGIRQARAGRMVATCAAFALSASCSDGGTGPSDPVLSLGSAANAANGQSLQVAGGSTGGEYVLVVTDTAVAGTGTSTYTLTTTSLTAPGTVSPPATSLVPASSASLASLLNPSGPALDMAYGSRMNERHRQSYQALMQGARLNRQATHDLVRSDAVQPGDLLTLNVSQSVCDSVDNRQGRVAAVGTKSIVVADVNNPAGGFTDVDYARFAANFDTLIYPLDVANFGAPSDLDGNGRVILFFTRAVNELTPPRSQSFVGGFFFGRDLFPRTATARISACAGSNVAEMFYLLAPDPAGAVNGNIRTTGFVDSLTNGVIGHEFQHLINSSRRLYVTSANDFEVVWLNEGLSHIAEELLFYRESGLSPRQNLGAPQVGATSTTVNAFNQDQASNASRYKLYLADPSKNSPYRNDDSLATRGATWDFLRYAADRKVRSGGTDADVFQALVNSNAVGVANLRAVFGADLGGMFRDWSVSQYTDDYVTAAVADFTQPSWNWRSLYPALGRTQSAPAKPYPLQILPLSAPSTTGTIVPGGAAFYRFSVAANTTASISVSGGTPQTGLPQGTIVRIR
jgi:hypothetical protein